MAITTSNSISVKARRDMAVLSLQPGTAPGARKETAYSEGQPILPDGGIIEKSENHPPAWGWSTETYGFPRPSAFLRRYEPDQVLGSALSPLSRISDVRFSAVRGTVPPADDHYEILLRVYPGANWVSNDKHYIASSSRRDSRGREAQAVFRRSKARMASPERRTALRTVRKVADSSRET